jgi:hypothetical protein
MLTPYLLLSSFELHTLSSPFGIIDLVLHNSISTYIISLSFSKFFYVVLLFSGYEVLWVLEILLVHYIVLSGGVLWLTGYVL